MTDPRFQPALREGLQSSDLWDSWTADAACRKQSLPGRHWDACFADELSEKRDIWAYDWPETAVDAMRVCATCPVRRRCLEYAFEIEKSEGDQWWSGEMVESDRRFGILGMVPGRIRERFAQVPCPVCAGVDPEEECCNYVGKIPNPDRIEQCEEWGRDFAAKRRWTLAEPMEDLGRVSGED